MKSGNVLELKEDSAKIVGEVQAQGIMVDGLGVGDVGNIVLRDRQHLSENGLLVVVLTMERGSGQVLAGPDIVSRGFVYVREAENLMDECLEIVNIALERLFVVELRIGARSNPRLKIPLMISFGKRRNEIR